MPVVTLQNKLSITSSSSNESCLMLLQSSNAILEGIPFRILSNNRSKIWEDFKYSYPQQLKEANNEITEIAKHYLRHYKPQIHDLSNRHQLTFVSFEVESSECRYCQSKLY
jgi:hypothetical protein